MHRSAAVLVLLAALGAAGHAQQIRVTRVPVAPLPGPCGATAIDQAWARGSTLVWRGTPALVGGDASAVALLVGPYTPGSATDPVPPGTLVGSPSGAVAALGPRSWLLPLCIGPQPSLPELVVDLPHLEGELSIRALYVSAESGTVCLGPPWIVQGAAALPADVQQDPDVPVFTGTPAPGARPGTQRWIVHFERRGFDVGALAAEYHGGKAPGRVAAIVTDLEARMRADQAPFVTAVERLGARVVKQWWLVNACLIEVAPSELARVRALPNVGFLQPDEAVAPVIRTATDGANHDADALQAAGYTGTGVAAAILDTGHDSDMGGTGQIHVIYSTGGDKGQSRLLFNKQIGAMPADDVHGHGTGVDSIVAGYRWNTAAADDGHAFGANIAGYAIADFTYGSSYYSTMATAYETVAADAAANNIVTTNLSYGGSPSPQSLEQKAADSLALTADVLNCTAAGNSGADLSGSLLNLNGLSVGATYPVPWPSNPGLAHTVASFSCRGLINGNMPFPDLCANGVATVMARRDNEGSDWVASGTSMASPQVCGAATQLRARFPALWANEVKAILVAAAQASPGTGATQSTSGPGCGYLHNPTAHEIAGSPLRHGRAALSKQSTTWTRTLPVTQGTQLQVAVAWHRLDANSRKFKLADLDLQVRDGSTVVASSANSVSTLEFVRFTAPTSGSYTIVVTAEKQSLPGGSGQEFAWASSGDTAPTP